MSEHQREKTIFNAALQLPNEEARTAYLKEACGDDLPLRMRVEALLQDHPEVGSFMENPPKVVADAAAQAKTADSTDQGLTAGTLWAGRYRIVGLLGEGGMGKVYRADDLKLGQSVALKFLPHRLATDALWLARFRSEVRIAREVAHPNVCRVYDIGEAEGEHFISMEYVDGEDLASLLRRIGRLPQDKAIEIGRQLCAGIAAAHDKGVLHRDLKPANIMIDGRGKVRITDFGIAAMAGTPAGDQIRAGTPAYMAPEQLDGTEVTVRSDLYSLGLVLYELFTGKKAIDANSLTAIHRAHERGTPRTPSSHIKDLDLKVEEIILQCLEKNPKNRPRSAIAVAAALPGADLLAAALAAGETPSPEMVAEAGETGVLRPAIALPCFAGVALLLVCMVLLKDQFSLLRMVPLLKPPDVLLDRAQQISKRLGYADTPADRGYWFSEHEAYLSHIARTDSSPERWKRLASGRPAAIIFFYRASPRTMYPNEARGKVTWADPPFTVPTMMRMQLDTQGRLLAFHAVPPIYQDVLPSDQEPDWPGLFAEAELDMSKFTPATPAWTPPVYCDRRMAWTGAHSWKPDWTVRIEAGSLAGKPVFFELVDPAIKPPADLPGRTLSQIPIRQILREIPWSVTPVVVLIAGAYLARRNALAGRGDRRGAWRLSLFVFATSIGQSIFAAHSWRWDSSGRILGLATANAVISWLLYIALEPYARRYWPQSLISWNRLLAGRIRDPLVGRDILVGCLVGVLAMPVQCMDCLIGLPGIPGNNDILLGGQQAIALLLEDFGKVGSFIGFFLLLVLLRLLFKRTWAASGVFIVLVLLTAITQPYLRWVIAVIIAALILFTVFRFGLLALVFGALTGALLTHFPSTFDFSLWYASAAISAPLFVAALSLYGCWAALARQPLIKDEVLTG